MRNFSLQRNLIDFGKFLKKKQRVILNNFYEIKVEVGWAPQFLLKLRCFFGP